MVSTAQLAPVASEKSM